MWSARHGESSTVNLWSGTRRQRRIWVREPRSRLSICASAGLLALVKNWNALPIMAEASAGRAAAAVTAVAEPVAFVDSAEGVVRVEEWAAPPAISATA